MGEHKGRLLELEKRLFEKYKRCKIAKGVLNKSVYKKYNPDGKERPLTIDFHFKHKNKWVYGDIINVYEEWRLLIGKILVCYNHILFRKIKSYEIWMATDFRSEKKFKRKEFREWEKYYKDWGKLLIKVIERILNKRIGNKIKFKYLKIDKRGIYNLYS